MPSSPYIQVKVNGIDITSSINWKDFNLTQKLTKETGQFQFTIDFTPATLLNVPKLEDEIEVYIYSGATTYKYFGGTVTMTEVTVKGGIQLQMQVTCADWAYSLNKKLVVKNYANEDPGNIVKDLLNNFTDGSFGQTYIQLAGYTIPSIKFNYQPFTKCIQDLANLIGWDWNVDADKNLHFFLSENNPAPLVIDDTSGNVEWKTLDWQQDLSNMKNSVYVIGSTYKQTFTAANTPDQYKSVAGTYIYPLAYKYDLSTITVKLGGVSQTVGSAQSSNPSSFQVLYSDVGRWIQFASDPGAGNSIVIYGTAIVPIVAHSSDLQGIATYGEIQDVISDTKITTVQEAYLRAQAEIAMYGHAVNNLKFSTLSAGFMVGQTLTFNSTKFQAIYGSSSLQLTVKTVTVVCHGPLVAEFQIEAIGSDQVTFVDLMSQLLLQEVSNTQVDNSTVTEELLPIIELVTVTDTVTISAAVYPYQFAPGTPKVVANFSRFG